MRRFLLTPALFFLLAIYSSGQIKLDENYDDWSSIPLAYNDSLDDIQGNIGFGKLKIYDDDRYLYFFIEVGKEINLQDGNEITIYLDADNNQSTGKAYSGLGADMEFTFGKRSGIIYSGNSSESIRQSDIGLVTSPTVSSSRFEFAFDRNSRLSTIMSGNIIRIAFADGSSGDVLPNELGGIVYELSNTEFVPPYYQIKRSHEADFRVMTFNVERDHIFEPSQQQHYENMIQAIAPDIIGFQEIYDHTSSQTADLVNQFLPGNWYHASASNDNICVSKYPILEFTAIDANAAFLIDLGDSTETGRLLFICAHPPCCNNNEQRQAEIDNIMAFVRDSKNGLGEMPIEENTPIIIVGDMNLVGYARQQYTFYSGDIYDEQKYGNDFTPDWDGTFFDDIKPVTAATPFTFTWYSEGSSFNPGRLDYVIYSGSVLEAVNSFVLFTSELPDDTLSVYGLNREDSKLASDHIPVAVDFKFKFISEVKDQNEQIDGFRLERNYPNPFNNSTVIEYSINSETPVIPVELQVFNWLGEKVATLVNREQFAGRYRVLFDASGLSSGVYFVQLTAGNYRTVRSIQLIK